MVFVFPRDALTEAESGGSEVCLVVPDVCKSDFSTFHSALFAPEKDDSINAYVVIRTAEILGIDFVRSLAKFLLSFTYIESFFTVPITQSRTDNFLIKTLNHCYSITFWGFGTTFPLAAKKLKNYLFIFHLKKYK